MAETTKIEWTDYTFNPWRGCTKVSAGCANCYAETMSGRNPGTLGVWGPQGTRVVAAESYWRQPVKWNRQAAAAKESFDFACATARSEYDEVGEWHRPRVFCASLADVFEDWAGLVIGTDGEPRYERDRRFVPAGFGCDCDVPRPGESGIGLDSVRRRLFALIDATPHLDWLILSKRPENVRRMWVGESRSNVWLGTSVEDQANADRRIPELLKCRDLAPVLFLSADPLLGEVNLDANRMGVRPWHDEPWMGGIGWVIIGGESGHGARPCNVGWVRSLVQQCQEAGVPAFVKQLGSKPSYPLIGENKMIDWPRGTTWAYGQGEVYPQLRDRKGGDPAEWPEDLRVREFPEAALRAAGEES